MRDYLLNNKTDDPDIKLHIKIATNSLNRIISNIDKEK